MVGRQPTAASFVVDTGVAFAMEAYQGGFPGDRRAPQPVLWVGRDGAIKEVATFGNEVPVGLETAEGQSSSPSWANPPCS